MDFVKYQHVERLGTDKVNGILNGIVHVFPKIDGTNTSLWMDNGELCVGNRRNKLNYELDNYHSYEILRKIDKYTKFFVWVYMKIQHKTKSVIFATKECSCRLKVGDLKGL